MVLLASFSGRRRGLSRWSGRPLRTRVSHALHTLFVRCLGRNPAFGQHVQNRFTRRDGYRAAAVLQADDIATAHGRLPRAGKSLGIALEVGADLRLRFQLVDHGDGAAAVGAGASGHRPIPHGPAGQSPRCPNGCDRCASRHVPWASCSSRRPQGDSGPASSYRWSAKPPLRLPAMASPLIGR